MKALEFLSLFFFAQPAFAGQYENEINPRTDLSCQAGTDFSGNPYAYTMLALKNLHGTVVFGAEASLMNTGIQSDCDQIEELKKRDSIRVSVRVKQEKMINESNGKVYTYETITAALQDAIPLHFLTGGNDGKWQ